MFLYRDTALVTVSAGGLGLAAVDLASNLFNAKVRCYCYNTCTLFIMCFLFYENLLRNLPFFSVLLTFN